MNELAPLTPSSRIYVAGHRGLVGSAIVRHLEKGGYVNLILATRAEVDLRNQAAVSRFFARQRPEFVFLAAAKVGGILANSTRPAEFLYDNLAIQTNVIHAAWQNGAQKLVFLGSSCLSRLAVDTRHNNKLSQIGHKHEAVFAEVLRHLLAEFWSPCSDLDNEWLALWSINGTVQMRACSTIGAERFNLPVRDGNGTSHGKD